MPSSGCDLRDVSLPESFRLRGSMDGPADCGRWQLAHEVLPEAEARGSKNTCRPRSTSALSATGRGCGRLYSAFMADNSLDEMARPAIVSAVAGAGRRPPAMMTPAATDSVIRISRPLLNTCNVSGLSLARSRRKPQQKFPAGNDRRAGDGRHAGAAQCGQRRGACRLIQIAIRQRITRRAPSSGISRLPP